MGFFSWKTSDTNKSISNSYSNKGALPVYLFCPDGTKIKEDNYEGYGVFNGQDAYALVAKWNCPEKCTGDVDNDRNVGIDIACHDDQNANLKYPLKFAENPDSVYSALQPSKGCELQGFFYGDENEEDY